VTTSQAYELANRIVGGCWIAFGLVWLIAAFTTKRTVYRQSLAQRLTWQAMVIAGAIAFFNAPREPYPLDAFFVRQTAATALISAVLCILGTAFSIWARAVIGKNWSGRVTLKENHELVQRGPYRLVRHPIYTGLILMTLGTALLIGRYGALAGWIVLTLSFWIKSRQEESLMLHQFPAEYAAYRQRTKRLVPFVY
jgi:protein-S-isoprenylcysteine O-methyltransferase Ste14